MCLHDRKGVAPDRARVVEPIAAPGNAASRATELVYRPVDEVQRDIERVMRDHPRLSANGFGFTTFAPPEEYERRLRESREAMLSEAYCLQFERARAWLQQCAHTKTFNRKITSYGLKHLVEYWMKAVHPRDNYYASNGIFIAAAIHLGFKFRRTDNRADNPNVYLNLALPKQ
jgi:hypothetical protein